MSKVSVVGTQLVAVFVSVSNPDQGAEPIVLNNGRLVIGDGERDQRDAQLAESTLGAMREYWKDDHIGGDMHPATRCWIHNTGHPNAEPVGRYSDGVTTVLVRMPLVSGWGDEVDTTFKVGRID